MIGDKIKAGLNKSNPVLFSVYAIIAAFCTHACMYAFRKPFTAASYVEAPELFGLTYKTAIVIIQVIGYTLSKFIGIKVVSEMTAAKRAKAIIGLIAIAWLALLGFAVVPAPYNVAFLFLNGLPLGMIWGLVFSYLEGRKYTEIMGLGLCASFIFASGFVKDVGRWLMELGVPEFWMPFATGAVFALPLIFFVAMLNTLPEPSDEDKELRTERAPMSGAHRLAFFKEFGIGLVLLTAAYMFLTAYRDFRDNFMADIWADLRGAENTVDFSATETPVSIGTLLILMLIVFIKNNQRALMINHLAIFIGVMIAGVSTWMFHADMISDYSWMFLTGFGTYAAYIPFNAILFDRLIAAFKYISNVGFLIYVADAFGYLGSVSVLIYKDIFVAELSWLQFFTRSSYALAGVSGGLIVLSAMYFWWKHRQVNPT